MSHRPPYSEWIWTRFWRVLGWDSILKDESLWAALALTAVSFPLWLRPLWWDATISVLSILIGFSVSGFGVALTLISTQSSRILKKGPDGKPSPLVVYVAGFVHYFLVGFAALAVSVLCKAWYFPEVVDEKWGEDCFLCSMLTICCRLGWLFTGFLFWYSITLVVRCVMSIFRTSQILERIHEHENEQK